MATRTFKRTRIGRGSNSQKSIVSSPSLALVVLFLITMHLTMQAPTAYAACSSCLVSSVVGTAGVGVGVGGTHAHAHAHSTHGPGRMGSPHRSALLYIVVSRLTTHFGTNGGMASHHLLSQQNEEKSTSNGNDNAKEEFDKLMNPDDNDNDTTPSINIEKPVSAGMVGAIGFYKNFISPLLPPACRFLPTCSQYGVQAIEEFGPNKGLVLTAWRLMRCSPFGGRGYDPPKWPPVAYNYGSY